MGTEGRTAVRPSGITPDFHAAFKQTWYKTNRDSGGYAAVVNFDVFPGRGMGIVWARQPD